MGQAMALLHFSTAHCDFCHYEQTFYKVVEEFHAPNMRLGPYWVFR
jgi:hypothetical protein